MTKKKTLSVVVILVAIALLAYTLLNRGRQLIGYLSYSLKSVMIHTVGFFNTTLKVAVTIDNPSNTAVSAEALKIELYYIDKANSKRKFLASSNTMTLNLIAHGSLKKEFYVDVSNSSLVSLFGSAILNGSQSVLSGKVSVLIKTTIAGQYTEKEIMYQ